MGWKQESQEPGRKPMPDAAPWGKKAPLELTSQEVAISRPTHPTPQAAAPNQRMWIRRSPARNSHPGSEKKAAARRAQHKNDREVSSPVLRKACRNRLENTEKGKPKRR